MAKFRPKTFEIEAVRYRGDAGSMLDIAVMVHGAATAITPGSFRGVAVLIVAFPDQEVAVKEGEWLVKSDLGFFSPSTHEDLMHAFDEVK